jgi:hypothetical protein
MKFRVTFDAERANARAGITRITIAINTTLDEEDDLMVKTPSPLHRMRK